MNNNLVENKSLDKDYTDNKYMENKKIDESYKGAFDKFLEHLSKKFNESIVEEQAQKSDDKELEDGKEL